MQERTVNLEQARRETDLHKLTVPDRYDNPTEIVDMSWVEAERDAADRIIAAAETMVWAVEDLKDYETTGAPEFVDWEAKYRILYDAVATFRSARE